MNLYPEILNLEQKTIPDMQCIQMIHVINMLFFLRAIESSIILH